jgi:hypothetical protein
MKELIPFILKWNTKTLGITFEDFKLNAQRIFQLSPTRDNYNQLNNDQLEILFKTIYIDKLQLNNLNKNLQFFIADYYTVNFIWALRNIIKIINITYNENFVEWSDCILWIEKNQNNELYNLLYNSRLNFNNTMNINNDRANDLYRYIMTLK